MAQPDPSPPARDTAPLILTAVMGSADFAWADGLRRAHFPAERNLVPAHITLFHHLPPARLPELIKLMREICGEPPPPARLSRIIKLGRGVAFGIDSPDLMAMRDHIADWFRYDLMPQDRNSPRLHITIQNKAEPAAAKLLFDQLDAGFRPRAFAIAGLAAWHYVGGPWRLAHQVKFRG